LDLSPTTLVLGAGASVDYGFPTGAELVTKILNGLESRDRGIALLLHGLGHDWPEVKAFAATLARSGTPSVDAFLEQRKDLRQLGKRAIASALLPLEGDEGPLFSRSSASNWYQYLFGRLVSKWTQLSPGDLSVVTFNYDRSLEHYLHVALRNFFGARFDEHWSQRSPVHVVHVHGALGEVDWSDPNWKPLHGTLNSETFDRAANKVRIVSEGSRDDEAYAEARHFILGARRVYFVGFGFHDENVDRLAVSGMLAGKAVYSTRFDFSEQQTQQIRGRLGSQLFWSPLGMTNTEAFRYFAPYG
jgi:SIR2-like domain